MSKFISRRDFLKGTAAGTATLAATSLFGSIFHAEDAAQGAALYTPGTYTATAKGIESDVTVTMTFDETSILEVTVDTSGETEGIGAGISDQMADAILAAQSAEVMLSAALPLHRMLSKRRLQAVSPRQRAKQHPRRKLRQRKQRMMMTGLAQNPRSVRSLRQKIMTSSSSAPVFPASARREPLPKKAAALRSLRRARPLTAVPVNSRF